MEARVEQVTGQKQICCTKWWCCCVAILVAALLSLLLILVTQGSLIHRDYVYKNGTAQGSHMHPKYVFRNTTAELQFDHMPYYAQVALGGSGCPPEGQLYVIRNQDCSNLPYVVTNYVNFWNPVDHVYMRPRSRINFTMTPAATGQVWILPDYRYDEYSENKEHFNCHFPPSGAYCFEASQYKSYLYSVTQPSYYYIRLQPPSFNVTPNKRDYNQSYDRVLFNIDAIPPSTTVTTYTLSSDFTTIYFREPFSWEKTCVLLNIPADSFCVTPIKVKVSQVWAYPPLHSLISGVEDGLIYLAMLLICLAVLCMLVYFHRN